MYFNLYNFIKNVRGKAYLPNTDQSKTLARFIILSRKEYPIFGYLAHHSNSIFHIMIDKNLNDEKKWNEIKKFHENNQAIIMVLEIKIIIWDKETTLDQKCDMLVPLIIKIDSFLERNFDKFNE